MFFKEGTEEYNRSTQLLIMPSSYPFSAIYGKTEDLTSKSQTRIKILAYTGLV